MFNKKNKKQNGFLGELNENPMLKQIVFFGFYFVFFVVLIILLRVGYKNKETSSSKFNINKTGYRYEYKLDRILNQNYHFVFKESLNGEEVIYEGDLFDNEMSFVKSGVVSTNYYMKNDKFYIKDNNLLTWSETLNPMLFYQFTNSEYMNKFIKKAKYISRTEYINSDNKDFLYEISNNEIRSILGLEEVMNDEDSNEIVVSISSNGKVDSIKYDLTNYYKYSDINIKSYDLVFSFSKYDEIEEIANPIN